MSFPLEIEGAGLRLSLHLIFETLAFFLGYRYFRYLQKKQSDPIPEGNRLWIIIAATFGAFFFSRLVGALENPTEWFSSPHPLIYFFVAKTIVGGLLGGLLCVELAKKILGEKSSSGDLFTYPLILAMMIGRIGCLSMGVYEPTFGNPSDLPWALDLGDGIPRHPVALYEMIFLGLLWLILAEIEKRKTYAMGVRFKFFMMAYLLFRFFVDFIKPGTIVFLGLTTIQLFCMLGLVYYSRTLKLLIIRPSQLFSNVR